MTDMSPLSHALQWQCRWLLACTTFSVAVALAAPLFWSDIAAVAYQWWHVNSYSYCLLIIPLVFLMVWTNRTRLRDLAPEPWPWGALVIALFSVVWSLAYLCGIAEIAQFMIVGMIQGLLLTLFGCQIYRRLWLPFTCLWLLVPTGEFLIPTLQSLTTAGATGLLELFGIVTYRENLAIMVPTGSFMVAPGCSGLSFLLSALVTSVTFADMFFRSRLKKISFVLACTALSVAGNALRVFLIIIIANITNNFGDIVDDHLVYGWVLFSVLLVGALVVGYHFRDDLPVQPSGGLERGCPPVPVARHGWSLALALGALAAAPFLVGVALPDRPQAPPVMPALSCGSFSPIARNELWKMPSNLSILDGIETLNCARDGHAVHLVLAMLQRPIRRGKLIGLERWLSDRDHWPRLDMHQITALVDGRGEPVQAEMIGQGDTHRLVWSLFWTGGAWRVAGFNTLRADMAADLTGHRRAAAVMLGTADVDGGLEAATILQNFLAGLTLGPLLADTPGDTVDKEPGR